jgi:hypothetical protein
MAGRTVHWIFVDYLEENSAVSLTIVNMSVETPENDLQIPLHRHSLSDQWRVLDLFGN